MTSAQLNVRPGERTLAQLDSLAALYSGSRTAVIRIAIDRMYAEEVPTMTRDLRPTSPDPVQQWGWLREVAGNIWSNLWMGNTAEIDDTLAEDLVDVYLDQPDIEDELPQWWDDGWKARLVAEIQGYADRDVADANADA